MLLPFPRIDIYWLQIYVEHSLAKHPMGIVAANWFTISISWFFTMVLVQWKNTLNFSVFFWLHLTNSLPGQLGFLPIINPFWGVCSNDSKQIRSAWKGFNTCLSLGLTSCYRCRCQQQSAKFAPWQAELVDWGHIFKWPLSLRTTDLNKLDLNRINWSEWGLQSSKFSFGGPVWGLCWA